MGLRSSDSVHGFGFEDLAGVLTACGPGKGFTTIMFMSHSLLASEIGKRFEDFSMRDSLRELGISDSNEDLDVSNSLPDLGISEGFGDF